MSRGALRFRPRAWALALAALGCAAGIVLGNWQWERAAERRAALEALAKKRTAVRGELLPQYTVLLDFRTHRGRPGYHVAQPLRLAGSARHVVVLRGWIAAGERREALPAIVTPAGELAIEGAAIERLPQYLEPGGAAAECRPGGAPCVWQNLTLERFGAWSGLALEPRLVEQTSELADGLARDWERPEAGWRKNEMYALQWYSLAALSVALVVVLGFRRE